jgi:hypothetical protein
MAIVQVLSKREGEIKLGDFSSTLYREKLLIDENRTAAGAGVRVYVNIVNNPSAHGWIDKDRVKNLNKEG